MEWKDIHHALKKIEDEEGLQKQLVVRPDKGHVTGESRRQMKDKIKFNTEGNDKTCELANMGADLGKANKAEWLASEVQNRCEQVKKNMRHAARNHVERREQNDMQPFEDKKQVRSSFQEAGQPDGSTLSTKMRYDNTFACTKCGTTSERTHEKVSVAGQRGKTRSWQSQGRCVAALFCGLAGTLVVTTKFLLRTCFGPSLSVQ